MNFDKLIARVRGILMTPKIEWPVIAAEPATIADLYKFYIAVLAALPAVGALIATHSLPQALMQYVVALGAIYLASLIVDLLAPTFGAQKSPIQALKLVAYAATPSFIGGFFVFVPVLGFIIALAAAVYAVYLTYLGLPSTMRCASEKAGPYTAAIIIAEFLIIVVLIALFASVIGFSAFGPRYG